MYIRVVSRASNFPRLLLFEKTHQPRRKLLIRLHDFHRGISKAVGRPQENNSWRLTVTDRGGNWFTGVFLPGKIPPRRDTTLRWPGRGMRLIRPPRVLLPRKITAAHPPPLILEITFPGIPPPALFFPMVAGYFSGGQRSRDIVRYLSGWSWVDGRDGRPLGSRILTCTSTITIFDNVSKNICVCARLIQVWTRNVETIKEIRESLTRRFRGWRPRIATQGSTYLSPRIPFHDFSMLFDSSLFAFTHCLRLDFLVSRLRVKLCLR